MEYGTTTKETSNADLEANLNLIVEDLYKGLTNIARQVRGGDTPENIAERLEQLALDICRHWPICAATLDQQEEKRQS